LRQLLFPHLGIRCGRQKEKGNENSFLFFGWCG
jgi:hypothetical protein